ncbi:hypothetical protein EF294_18680 [Gordonia oryzae]|uniref:DUF2231 domain-containing protein n=1 Tax=Gordonia oryzae TaxID=2487349 RepID=A0A3N4G2Y1_9ACTN|nr:DUF2231 domain-containing protein [Gordonia oryzae]RPA57293.1 hypothetical protein EF294_18680 [Gordonia oryzae]
MDTINGIPAHPLFVHLAVVAIPLAALLAGVGAVWPSARRRLGIVPLLVATIALVVTPLTTSAGEALQQKTAPNPDLVRHAELGDQMIAWVATLFTLTVLWWAAHDERILARVPRRPSAQVSRTITVILAVAIVIVAVGTLVMVVLVGDAGARSVWLH